MTRYFIAVMVGIATVLLGYGVYQYETSPSLALSGFSDPFISVQLATDPQNGDCLTTDGSANAWGDCGAGGGSLDGTGTTSQLAYFTDSNTLTSIATGTLSESVTGLALSASRYLVGGDAALSLDAGYTIPLSASTTNWNAFYDTPSTVITAGTGIDWTGNTLDVTVVDTNTTYTAGDGLTLTGTDFDCDTASGSVFGCLTAADWSAFNEKVSSTSIDTVGEIQTLVGGQNLILETEIDGCTELIALLDDETGTCGGVVFSTNPLLAGFRSNASSTIGDGTATGGLTISGNATTSGLLIVQGTGTSTIAGGLSVGTNHIVAHGAQASDSAGFHIHSNNGTSVAFFGAGGGSNITLEGGVNAQSTLSVTGLTTLGNFTATNGTTTNATSTSFFSALGRFTTLFGLTTLTIPNGTNPTADDVGELAHDTTDNQLILDDYVFRSKEEIFNFAIPSTSPAFATGTVKYLPVKEDGYVVSDIFCFVEGGTSKAITLFGESITCDADGAVDDGTISIPTIASASTTAGGGVTASTTVGVVNWLNVTITGNWTRE